MLETVFFLFEKWKWFKVREVCEMTQDTAEIAASLHVCLETHEFHNYCIMLQDRVYTCCPPAWPASPFAWLLPTFIVRSGMGKGERLGWGGELCNPCSLSWSRTVFFSPDAFYLFIPLASIWGGRQGIWENFAWHPPWCGKNKNHMCILRILLTQYMNSKKRAHIDNPFH